MFSSRGRRAEDGDDEMKRADADVERIVEWVALIVGVRDSEKEIPRRVRRRIKALLRQRAKAAVEASGANTVWRRARIRDAVLGRNDG